MQPKNMSEWSVDEHEIAKYAPIEGAANASSLKLYIPKILPFVPFGTPTQTVTNISKSFLLNADQCKPSIATTIKTQNYLTVPRYANNSFAHSLLRHGSRLIVEVLNRNVDTIRVTNREDPSYDPLIE